MIRYLLLEKDIVKNAASIFDNPIDLQKIYEHGYFETSFPMPLSSAALRAVNRSTFQLTEGTLFRKGVNAALLHGGTLNPILKTVVNNIYSQALSVLSLYNTEEFPLSTTLMAYKPVDGDKMPWIEVSSTQAVLGFYILFKEPGKYTSDYPLFEFATVKYDDAGRIIQRESMAQLSLRDESLVVFYDPCNFNVTHRISEIFGEEPSVILHGLIGGI